MTRTFLLVASFPDSVLDFRGELIAELKARNVVVHIAAPAVREGSAVRDNLEAAGLHVHEIPLRRTGTNPAADIQLLWNLSALIRRIRPDAVLSYTIKPVIYASLAAYLGKVPRRFALITGLGHTFANNKTGLVPWLVQRLYRLALSRIDKVFFQNPDDEALFRDLGILSDRTPSIVVNGSGVDLSEYDVVRVATKPPQFLMIARLLGDKGVREYADAARKIRETHPDIQFDLVGWIDENPDAISQKELDAWIEEGCIEFLGRLEDVRPMIAESTVYVLPSYREGTPRTVLEAMAMGRPIITTDAPGCRETVIDGENGFLIPIKSVDSLIAAMQRFIDDPQLAERMGERSREIAEEKYDVHKANAVMLREMGIT